MLSGESRINLQDAGQVSPWLDLCYTDPAKHLITAGWDVDDLDCDF